MKRIDKHRIRNGVVLVALYAFLTLSFFDRTPSYWRGSARGTVIGTIIICTIILISTVFYTLKDGGNWNKVAQNIKGNFLAILSFSWRDK